MTYLFPVSFNQGADNGHVVFVGFDSAAASDFARAENDQAQCDIMDIDQVALVDNYGFPCTRADAGMIAPWLADCPDFAVAHYAPESWARYVRDMSVGG